MEAGKVLDEESVLKMKEALGGISDPLRQCGYLRHALLDILVIGLCFVITSGADFEDMEDLGRDSEEWFCRFLERSTESSARIRFAGCSGAIPSLAVGMPAVVACWKR